ncbi:MAG: hypothetical protein LIO70_01315 [Clostridiales bacterium]|nr:hypothetical protein [Clostridiales bacterium]
MADKYAILQLQETGETARERFMSLSYLREHGMEPNPEHYDLVYTANLTGESLEELFILFNTVDMPKGFAGHAMSTSDIVAVIKEGLTTGYFYCDSIGFKPLPGFQHRLVEHLREE